MFKPTNTKTTFTHRSLIATALLAVLATTELIAQPNASVAESQDKIVIETEEARISYLRASRFVNYDGTKRYGVLTLIGDKKVIGYLESREDSIIVHGVPDLDRVALKEIVDIRWLNQVLIKNGSGEILIGYLIEDMADALILEPLSAPKTTIRLPRREIESITEVREAQYVKKRVSRPRVALLAGPMVALGTFRNLFREGWILGLSFQQNFSRLFRTESYWFPDLRIDTSGISFQNNGFNYSGLYLNAGPMWILNGVFAHRGIISVGFLPGVAYERASSPFLPEGASSYTFTFQGALSYEYPVWRRLYLGVDIRGLYSFDPGNPLFAAGGALRTSYQF